MRQNFNIRTDDDDFVENREGPKEESGDEIELLVHAEESSVDSDYDEPKNEDVEMIDESIISSNHISSLQEPSYQLFPENQFNASINGGIYGSGDINKLINQFHS